MLFLLAATCQYWNGHDRDSSSSQKWKGHCDITSHIHYSSSNVFCECVKSWRWPQNNLYLFDFFPTPAKQCGFGKSTLAGWCFFRTTQAPLSTSLHQTAPWRHSWGPARISCRIYQATLPQPHARAAASGLVTTPRTTYADSQIPDYSSRSATCTVKNQSPLPFQWKSKIWTTRITVGWFNERIRKCRSCPLSHPEDLGCRPGISDCRWPQNRG